MKEREDIEAQEQVAPSLLFSTAKFTATRCINTAARFQSIVQVGYPELPWGGLGLGTAWDSHAWSAPGWSRGGLRLGLDLCWIKVPI